MKRPCMCLQRKTSRDPMPVMAYARCTRADAGAAEVVVDKILTSPLRRGDGTAEALIERVLAAAGERWPGRGVRLLAPVSLLGFYEAFGFRQDRGAVRRTRGARDRTHAQEPS